MPMRHPAYRPYARDARIELGTGTGTGAIGLRGGDAPGEGITAARTPRLREKRQAAPARAAGKTEITRAHRSIANQAGAGHRKRQGVAHQRADRGARSIGQPVAAAHITSRAGARPNQRSNASAPCAISIPKPSAP